MTCTSSSKTNGRFRLTTHSSLRAVRKATVADHVRRSSATSGGKSSDDSAACSLAGVVSSEVVAINAPIVQTVSTPMTTTVDNSAADCDRPAQSRSKGGLRCCLSWTAQTSSYVNEANPVPASVKPSLHANHEDRSSARNRRSAALHSAHQHLPLASERVSSTPNAARVDEIGARRNTVKTAM